MPLVTAGLLTLPQLLARTVRVVIQVQHRRIHIARTDTVLEILDNLIYHFLIITQNTNRKDGSHLRQVPIEPIVVGCIVVTDKKIIRHSVECILHPLDKSLKLFRIPPIIISSQNLGSIGKLICLNSNQQFVRVYQTAVFTVNTLTILSPSIQNGFSGVTILRLIGKLPTQCQLIGSGSIICQIGIIYIIGMFAFPISLVQTLQPFHGFRLVSRVCKFAAFQ